MTWPWLSVSTLIFRNSLQKYLTVLTFGNVVRTLETNPKSDFSRFLPAQTRLAQLPQRIGLIDALSARQRKHYFAEEHDGSN
jgi:hypothetical protein